MTTLAHRPETQLHNSTARHEPADASSQHEMALIAALKRREQAALAEVFQRYADKIYRLAVGLLHDEQQADGVVQNTFLSLIEHIDNFEGRSSIGTWLYRVAYNEVQGRIRRVKPDVELDNLPDVEVMPTHFIDWRQMPEQMMSGSEAREQIDKAINSLSTTLREVFILRDIEELSTSETAHILNLTESAVKVRLHRARLLLRERLAIYFEEYART